MPAGLAVSALQGSKRVAVHSAQSPHAARGPAHWTGMGSFDSVPGADVLLAVTNAQRSHLNRRLEPVPCSDRMRRAARQACSGHAARDPKTKNSAALQKTEAEHSRTAHSATCLDSSSSRGSDQGARDEPTAPQSRLQTVTA